MPNGDIAVMADGETYTLPLYDPFVIADAAGASTDRIVTPMPGKIIQLLVKPGEAVKKGQPLAVLEAMKMEHTLAAPADAKVASVEVAQGDQVNDGAIVVRFETEKAA
jgi:3-methylcrotonyl-CoA carboxylase alpha subunit